MKDVLSTRLSIRKRGESLGHHQAIETQERFSSWRSEEFSKLVWTLGAMAAEHVFYGENSTGVGGDVMSATARAAWMVGMCAMGPNPIDLNGRFASADDEAEEREKLLRRFEDIGVQIMNRAGTGGPFEQNPIGAVLGDRDKRKAVSALLGQAYVTAYVTIAANRERVERVAEKLIQRKEMHGDEVVELLDSVELVASRRSTCSRSGPGRRYELRAANGSDSRFGSAQEHVAERPVGAGRELAAAATARICRRRFGTPAGSAGWSPGCSRSARRRWSRRSRCRSSSARVSTGGGSWSAWRPPDSGLTGAQEIADFVAPYYRATPADQLAVVTAVNLNNPANPLQVAVPASGSSGSLVPLPSSSTIVYNLCGVGSKDCSIGVGPAVLEPPAAAAP